MLDLELIKRKLKVLSKQQQQPQRIQMDFQTAGYITGIYLQGPLSILILFIRYCGIHRRQM